MDSKKVNGADFKFSYDNQSDVLYVSFGSPRPGVATEVNDGDFVRIDPNNREVIGITVIDFKYRYAPAPTVTIEDSVKKLVTLILKEYRP